MWGYQQQFNRGKQAADDRNTWVLLLSFNPFSPSWRYQKLKGAWAELKPCKLVRWYEVERGVGVGGCGWAALPTPLQPLPSCPPPFTLPPCIIDTQLPTLPAP